MASKYRGNVRLQGFHCPLLTLSGNCRNNSKPCVGVHGLQENCVKNLKEIPSQKKTIKILQKKLKEGEMKKKSKNI